MKTLFMILVGLSTSAAAYAAKDRIYFQKDSAWVMASNKSLCKTEQYYQATLSKCTKYNGREDSSCAREISYTAFQPITGTKRVCIKMGPHDRCNQWDNVEYYQSPDLEIRYYGAHDRVRKVVKVTVPNCR